VDAAVAPAAVAAAEALADSTAADTERVAKYLERYGAVRDKRAAMQVQLAVYVRTLQTHADQVYSDAIMRSVV
jgi:phage-related tail protein